MSFIGMIAGPLVAKRMRRTCGMSSSALPISSMFFGGELIRVAARDHDVLELRALAMYLNASSHCFGVLASEILSTFSVSGPIA